MWEMNSGPITSEQQAIAIKLFPGFVRGSLLGLYFEPFSISGTHPRDIQSWILIGGTDAEAEAPIFWPPDVKSWLIRKDPDAGKDWRQ